MKDWKVTLNDLEEAVRVFEAVESHGGRTDIKGRTVYFDQTAYTRLIGRHEAGDAVGISEDFGRFLWLDGNEYNIWADR